MLVYMYMFVNIERERDGVPKHIKKQRERERETLVRKSVNSNDPTTGIFQIANSTVVKIQTP